MKQPVHNRRQFKNLYFLFSSLLVFLLIATISHAEAQNPDQLFTQANAAYRSGNYKEAYSSYENLLKLKQVPDIYYNLGNSAFKTKKLGLAIVNYERARKLNPRDPDILENLKLAKSFVEYRVEDKRNWYYQKLLELLELVRFEELLAVSLSVYFVFLISILIPLLLKRQNIFSEFTTYVFVIFLIVAAPTVMKLYQAKIQAKAVVIQSKVEARFAPSAKEKIAFRLVEGISADVVDQIDDWCRISLASGDTGWVRKDEIVII